MRKARYSIDQCALHAIGGPKKLARILRVSNNASAAILQLPELYKQKQVTKKDGTARDVVAPHPKLKEIQARIASLLSRVEVPDYLHCPVKGRSYVTSARAHVGAQEIYLCDIADFFPSCSTAKVAWFFQKKMQNQPDVAGRLTSLTTLGDHLPQGSPASPYLAFFAYQDMWDELHRLVLSSGCKITVYADDIAISGDRVPGALRHQVRQIIERHGHSLKAAKEGSVFRRPVPLLGTVVAEEGLRLPNRQYKAAHELALAIAETKTGRKRDEMLKSLKGRRIQARQVVA